MRGEHIEVLVEEPSMEAALRLLLPKIVGQTSFEVHAHQGKHDLLKQLPARLRAYAKWMPQTWRIVVVVDQDNKDCVALKAELESAAASASLVTRARAGNAPYALVNRIACEELEAWYFGDWKAVRRAYPRVPASLASKARYRDPDAIVGTWEAFERELQDAGYFRLGLAKIEAAQAIAPHMAPERNASASFQALRRALAEMATP
jgi:hypothetical protein